MLWLIWAIPLTLLVILIVIVLLRALAFRPQPEAPVLSEPVVFDQEKAVRDLQAMIRCATVSNADPSRDDVTEFDNFAGLLPQLFPLLHQSCSLERHGPHGLLYRWRGRTDGPPSVMMAHYDVVAVDAGQWSKPPFAAIIEDGELWGRGTLDTKATVNGILQAAEALIGQGFVPENDIWIALGGNEEVAGQDAPSMVAWFKDAGIQPGLVVDEGGAVVQNVFPGVHKACAVVGTAEKGMMQFEMAAVAGGGHASAPPPRSSLGRLAAACLRIEDHPLPRRLTPPVAGLFDTLGRHSSFTYRLIFANLWLFAGVLDMICKKQGGDLNAMLRTTVAWTQAAGSQQTNVMPTRASLSANIRIIPGETGESVASHLESLAADPALQCSSQLFSNPSIVSETGSCIAWQKVRQAIRGTWPDALVSPYLMVACSDSRHYCQISDHVYRFSAMEMSTEHRKTIHGNNERIPLASIGQAVEFYLRLLKMC